MIESYIFFPAIKILLILQGPNSLCYCGTFSNPKVRLDSYTLCICNYSITVFILTLNILCLFVILSTAIYLLSPLKVRAWVFLLEYLLPCVWGGGTILIRVILPTKNTAADFHRLADCTWSSGTSEGCPSHRPRFLPPFLWE